MATSRQYTRTNTQTGVCKTFTWFLPKSRPEQETDAGYQTFLERANFINGPRFVYKPIAVEEDTATWLPFSE